MSDAPEWHLPFAVDPRGPTDAQVTGLMVDQVTVHAAVAETPLGIFPVLVIDFVGSALADGGQPPRLIFTGPERGVRRMAQLISDAAATACSFAEAVAAAAAAEIPGTADTAPGDQAAGDAAVPPGAPAAGLPNVVKIAGYIDVSDQFAAELPLHEAALGVINPAAALGLTPEEFGPP